MLLEALWPFCYAWIIYRSVCRVILVTSGCDDQTWMMNIQAAKTCMRNIQVGQAYIQFIQVTNLASAQATQSFMTMKLHIKQYTTHITINLHGETIPTIILVRSL